jgi:hypothetical protein
MSGGDFSGSIDDIDPQWSASFASHPSDVCSQSSERLVALGEAANRIIESRRISDARHPGIDFIQPDETGAGIRLDLTRPLLLVTQHPVDHRGGESAYQMTETLERSVRSPCRPSSLSQHDAGSRAMIRVIDTYCSQSFLRVVPHLVRASI